MVACLAIVSAGSYYICSKSAPSQHHKKSEDEKKEKPEEDNDSTSKARTDLEEIYQEQKSIKYQIQCAVVFSATFLSTAYASFSIPSNQIGKTFHIEIFRFILSLPLLFYL